MISYKKLTSFFGFSLHEKEFDRFLSKTFSDLTEYNILESEYIVSKNFGIELGFTNNSAVYDDDEGVIFKSGDPIFSHFALYPQSGQLISELPFGVNFMENRNKIIEKAGEPKTSKDVFVNLLNKHYLIDHYLLGDIVISFDYEVTIQTLNFIQIRRNDLVEHLKI